MSEPVTISVTTPIGNLSITSSSIGLTGVSFHDEELATPTNYHDILQEAENQLLAYFNGQLKEFDLPMDFGNAPSFHTKVWHALCDIPYGEKVAYKDIADIVGQPKGSQAVGQANAKNPIAIIVPCHRVIGSNGNLTGYAGGLNCKRWLLEHELAYRPKPAHLLF